MATYLIEYTVFDEGYTIFRDLTIEAYNVDEAKILATETINRYPYLQPKIYSITRL